jgi:hypothetical protein
LFGVTTPLRSALPAWMLRLISELNAADERAIAVAKALSPEQLNWKQTPGEWSVGQCLDHMAIANEVYLQAMRNSLEGRDPIVVQEIRPGWFGRWFIRNIIEPSPGMRRTRAPKKIVPAAHVAPSVLDRFLRSNHSIRDFIDRARNYDVNRIRFRNPFVAVIRFTVGTGLEILSSHERRHLLQAERIGKSAGGAATNRPRP